MSETHWKRLINPDYLGGYSLDPGQDKILTIGQVRKDTFFKHQLPCKEYASKEDLLKEFIHE